MNLLGALQRGQGIRSHETKQRRTQQMQKRNLAKNNKHDTTILPIARQSKRNSRREAERKQYIPMKANPVQMMEFSQVKPKESRCLRSLNPTDVNVRKMGQSSINPALARKYQLVKKALSGALENFMRYMLSKYQFSVNHGLLPALAPKPQSHTLPTIALLGTAGSRDYQLAINPHISSTFLMHNDREFLQRQCSALIHEDSPTILQDIGKYYPQPPNSSSQQTLAVCVAAESSSIDKLLLGKDGEGLLSLAYQHLQATKRSNSALVLTVIGVQNEQVLTDELSYDRPQSQTQTARPKLKITRRGRNTRFTAEGVTRYVISNLHELEDVLAQYRLMRSDGETQRAGEKDWDWLQGELYQLSQVQYDNQYNTILRTIRSHYILRINQYLKSAASLMLKLGMALRQLQEGLRGSLQGRESPLFRLLQQCFDRKSGFKVILILQVGRSPTLHEEYLNLVPTSNLPPKQAFTDLQLLPFIYLKHYHDSPAISQLVNSLQTPNIGTINISQRNRQKSYVYDTFSSLQKRIVRNTGIQLEQEEQKETDPDIEEVIQETVQQYRQSQGHRSRPEGFNLSRNSQKHPSNKHRRSLLQWTRQQPNPPFSGKKIYRSRNQMASAQKSRQKVGGGYYLEGVKGEWLADIYGPKKPKAGSTRAMVQQIVQRQIIELGKEDQLFPQEFD